MARYLHAVSQILVTALTIIIPFAFADLTTTIDPSSNWGTWEGWGTSLTWWAAAFGTRDDLANIFFTSQTVTLNGVSLPGLGFNIARYNAGASSWNTINGTTKMVVSPKMIPSRQIKGFWMDWASTSPSSSSWNWSADLAQRAMLSIARARSANILELFSNSPMWWMCKNHNPFSSDDGSFDNLQSWNYQSHAVYMATVAKYFSDTWSTKFSSVDPFNEPTATWWNGKTGTQEGCHFDVSTQAAVLNHLRTELDSRGLSATTTKQPNTLQNLGSTALAKIACVNVHGYQYGSGRRDSVRSLATQYNKKLWQSEYGEGDATGHDLASNLLLDLRWLKPTAWVYWQVLNGGGWGLIDADNDKKTIAYDAASKKLVIVAVNWGSAQYLNFDLAKFKTPGVDGAVVKRCATQIGGTSGKRYVASSDTAISGTKFWSYFEKEMVQTFEVDGVVL
ncbi:glycoside hydrolase superfamily, partial [Sordaria sp. MPI-SDFR-AT-0083]